MLSNVINLISVASKIKFLFDFFSPGNPKKSFIGPLLQEILYKWRHDNCNLIKICNFVYLQITEITSVDDEKPVKFSQEVGFSVEKYEIV